MDLFGSLYFLLPGILNDAVSHKWMLLPKHPTLLLSPAVHAVSSMSSQLICLFPFLSLFEIFIYFYLETMSCGSQLTSDFLCYWGWPCWAITLQCLRLCCLGLTAQTSKVCDGRAQHPWQPSEEHRAQVEPSACSLCKVGPGVLFSPQPLKERITKNTLAGSSNGEITMRGSVSAAITGKLPVSRGALANLLHSVAVKSKAFSETLSNSLMDLQCSIWKGRLGVRSDSVI